MKLSEAIREGAKKRPMITGSYFEYDNYECQGSCALGAVAQAPKNRTLEAKRVSLNVFN